MSRVRRLASVVLSAALPAVLATGGLAGGTLLTAGGCTPARTAAATQPTPAAFDATKSDAKAVELADQVILALGGDAAYQQLQQLSWDVRIQIDEQVLEAHHDWDRWNGRHRYMTANDKGEQSVTAYEVFGEMQWATWDGDPVSRQDVPRLVETAKQRLTNDAFSLLFPYKLKDPGVILKYDGERPDPKNAEVMAFDVIKVSFEAGVGRRPGDVYYVVIRRADHVIEHMELVEQGKADDQRIGYSFEEWTSVGGLKVSLKRQNMGHAGEIWRFKNVKIAAPSDDLFIKALR